MSEIEIRVHDEPALIVTTGRNEYFIFADNGRPEPDVTGLGAAVLVTRLRWWADRIERRNAERALGMAPVSSQAREETEA